MTTFSIREPSTRYIAQVNSVLAATDSSNPYVSHRQLDTLETPSESDQLFAFQSAVVQQDAFVLDLWSRKYSSVAHAAARGTRQQSTPTQSAHVNETAVLAAAAHCRNASGKAALKKVLALLERRPLDVGLVLLATHLHVQGNNHAAATSVLEDFLQRLEKSATPLALSLRYAPGIVATLVSLYAARHWNGRLKDELAKAARYWQSQAASPSANLTMAAGTALLHGNSSDDCAAAAGLFASLAEKDGDDVAALAGVVAANAVTDRAKLSSDVVGSLPTVAQLVGGVDATKLEEAGVATSALDRHMPPKGRGRSAIAQPARVKRMRKGRMPAEYDPDKKVDPERWLPMRDRSYYKPKGKRGKKQPDTSTQGGAVVDERAKLAESKLTTGSGNERKNRKGKNKASKR